MNFSEFFLKEKKPFISKREIDSKKIKRWSGGLFVVMACAILFWPEVKPEQTTFHESAEKGSISQVKPDESNPSNEALRQFEESRSQAQQVHSSLDHLYRADTPVTMGSGGQNSPDRNSSMILTRGGNDMRIQLPAGTRVSIRLTGNTTISTQGMPVVGVVSQDVSSESGTAIPSGSKVLGDASFNEESNRASITWRSIILPDGRERPFSALGVDRSGQVGVGGSIHSEKLKNAVGQTLTRFVGAYASGSISSGMFGANKGGHANGLRNAIAMTATDRANSMGEDLQKEHKWIELPSGLETVAVLNQPFSFRDAGGTYGR